MDFQSGFLGTVIMSAMALNFVLSGLSKALEVVKDKTENKTDDKIYLYVNKAALIVQKVVDWASANRQH
jgi:hypothetical protein